MRAAVLVLVAAVLLVLLVIAEPADARLVSRSHVGTYTTAERDTVDAWFEYYETRDDPQIVSAEATAAWKCSRARVSILYENSPTGANLWRYSMRQGRCWNGRKITSLYHFKRWSEFTAWGWEFGGHIDLAKSGCAGCLSVYRFTQGKYQLCYPGFCLERRYPWLEMTLRGDGSIIRDKGIG
jgi:hypothetical protein